MYKTYSIFSDESNWNQRRFRSIAAISVPTCYIDIINTELDYLISSKHEIKWNNINGANDAKKINNIIRYVYNCHRKKRMKVDVLIWDIEDYRHKVKGRDDVGNFIRMYYQLFNFIIGMKYKVLETSWDIYMDYTGKLDNTAIECLKLKRRSDYDFESYYMDKANINSYQEIDSRDCRLVQLADLYAGIGSFSYLHFSDFLFWRDKYQEYLNIVDIIPTARSKRMQYRYLVLNQLCELYKDNFVTFDLQRCKGPITKKWKSYLNFWYFIQQHYKRKAPRKEKRLF